MSIMEYNGAAVVAMTGRGCVAIASDLRLGVQHQTVACDFHKVFRIHEHLYIGLPGLATDVQTVVNKARFRERLYALREERRMKPAVFAHMVSSMLYEKRFGPFFVEPIIAGLSAEERRDDSGRVVSVSYTPFITAMDLIGAGVDTSDFVVGGTSSEELYGVCEAMYRPDMEPEDLFETISQCLLAAADRDCLAGWGAVVHLMSAAATTTACSAAAAPRAHTLPLSVSISAVPSTAERVISRELKSRQD
jgi:20S proteasome subunit beta 3